MKLYIPKPIAMFTIALFTILVSSCDEVKNVVDNSDNDSFDDVFNPTYSDKDIVFSSIYTVSHKWLNPDVTTFYNQIYRVMDNGGKIPEGLRVQLNGTEIDNSSSTPSPINGDAIEVEITAISPFKTVKYAYPSIVKPTNISPLPLDTVISKSQGIDITYTPFVGCDGFYLVLYENAVLTHYLLDSTVSITKAREIETIEHYNTGTISLTPSLLSSFPSNSILEVNIIGYKSHKPTFNGLESSFIAACNLKLTYKLN